MANASDAEHCRDIDNANASNLHVVAGNLRAGADNLPAIHQSDFGDIISDQAITSFDQRQHALTLPDTALAPQDYSHTKNIHHAPHLGPTWSKHHLERQSGQIEKLHRDQWRTKDGYQGLFGGFQ